MARSPQEIAAALAGFAGDLSQKPLGDYARTASNEAGGRGRTDGATSVDRVPARIYASAVLDRNTCPACYGIDGKEYGSVEESLVDFPAGYYHACDGGPRCRCTRVYVWAEEGTTGDSGPGSVGGRGPDPAPAPAPPDPVDAGIPADQGPVPPGAPAPLPGKTAREAEEIAQAHPTLSTTPQGQARTFDYKGMDPEVANELNRTYAQLFDLYPEAAERVRYVGTQAGWKRQTGMRVRGAGRAEMWASKDTSSIATLPKFDRGGASAEARRRRLTWAVDDGFLAGGSEAHVIAHEFGHHVFWELQQNAGVMDEIAGALGKALGAEPGEVTWTYAYFSLGPNGSELRKRWREGLSKYSGTNTDELMAEAFGEYVTSANPRPIAQAIGEIIDRYLRRTA